MDATLRAEMEAAGLMILAHLEDRGDTPVHDLKNTLGIPEVVFYFGLGDLILNHRVSLRRHHDLFWAVRRRDLAKAA